MCGLLYIKNIYCTTLHCLSSLRWHERRPISHCVHHHHQSNHSLIKSTARATSSLHAAASPSVHGGTWLPQTCSNQRRTEEPGGHILVSTVSGMMLSITSRRVLALYGASFLTWNVPPHSERLWTNAKPQQCGAPGCSDLMEPLPLWYRSS